MSIYKMPMITNITITRPRSQRFGGICKTLKFEWVRKSTIPSWDWPEENRKRNKGKKRLERHAHAEKNVYQTSSSCREEKHGKIRREMEDCSEHVAKCQGCSKPADGNVRCKPCALRMRRSATPWMHSDAQTGEPSQPCRHADRISAKP